MTSTQFPRTLTPFERFMLVDERPGYPMTMMACNEMDGFFRRDLFKKAVASALEGSPILRSTVHRNREWRNPIPASESIALRWLPWSENLPAVIFDPIDLGQESGVRVFIQQDTERARVTIVMHHAITDGRGMAKFGLDILSAYIRELIVSLADDVEPPSSTLEASRSSSRAPRIPAVAAPVTQPGVETPPLGEMAGFLLRHTATIRASHTPRPGSRSVGAKGAPAQVVDHVFDADAFGHIRRKAREHDVSVNDVFMGAVFQTLVEWNASTHSSQWFRLMVPMDERSRDRAEVDTSHALGFAFVDRRGRDCVDTSSLLRGIGDEMRSARLNYIGRRFFDGIAAIDRIPGMLRLILRVPRTFSTAIFSNVGRIGGRAPVSPDRASIPIEDRFPSLRQVRGIAPLRPGTRAAFLLTRVQDEHTLMLRTDPRYLDEAAASAMLATCVDKVLSS